MMIRAYLEWSMTATASDRAEAVSTLGALYLSGELTGSDKSDAEAALMLAVEDPSPGVRIALASVLAGDERAPRPVIAALSRDQAEVAAIVLANSPVLLDAEIIDIAVFGSAALQQAACSRPHVSAELSAAIGAVCETEAAIVLLENPGAEITVDTLRQLTTRLGEDGAFREATLKRDDLPTDVKLLLAAATARQLSAHAIAAGWMPEHRAGRAEREATEAAAITLARSAGDGDMRQLAAALRQNGQLTPQLLMRAVLSGEVALFVAALSDLAEVDPARAQGFVLSRSMMGFGALYRKAGLPKSLEPAFAAAVAAWQELSGHMPIAEGRLSRVMIEMVISAVALLQGPDIDRLRALLGAYQAEAAREDARLRVAEILAEPRAIAEAEPELPLLAGDEPGDLSDDALEAVATVEPRPVEDLDARLQEALALEFRQAA
jgi:uncharacterized protein (DUF2336 family)